MEWVQNDSEQGLFISQVLLSVKQLFESQESIESHWSIAKMCSSLLSTEMKSAVVEAPSRSSWSTFG